MILANFVRKKNEFRSIKSKDFINQVNINLNLAKLNDLFYFQAKDDLIFGQGNKIKTALYRFSKVTKTFSGKKFNFLESNWKFQSNGFFVSLVEANRKKKVKVLKRKIKVLRNNKVVLGLWKRPLLDIKLLKERKTFPNLSFGLDRFENLYTDYSNKALERKTFLKTLKFRRFFPSILFSRLFLYTAKGKKKYRNVFFYLFKKKRKIDSLFHVYTLGSLKFKDIRIQRKKVYKRVFWKIKKQKKWRRRLRVSPALFRLRQKLSQLFYVPKHFEINYKTFATSYLGYTDAKTTNTKIVFWLNLRKLLTFIS